MATSRILRFGIMSVASIVNDGFMPGVKLTKGVEARAIASRNLEKAKQAAKRHGIPTAYGSYEELLRDAEVDCVYIPLPNSMHAEWTRKALNAGKHVLCEKPLAWSAREAASLMAPIKRSGLTFAEGFHYRYHPLMARIEEIVRSGDIG